jgi:hypothetical protein
MKTPVIGTSGFMEASGDAERVQSVPVLYAQE